MRSGIRRSLCLLVFGRVRGSCSLGWRTGRGLNHGCGLLCDLVFHNVSPILGCVEEDIFGDRGAEELPSSLTSITAILEVVAGASRFEEALDWASSSSESLVEDRRGRLATV